MSNIFDFVVLNDLALLTFASALPVDVYRDMDAEISLMSEDHKACYIDAAKKGHCILAVWDANLRESLISTESPRVNAIGYEYAIQRQIEILCSAIKYIIINDIDASTSSLKRIYNMKTVDYRASHSPKTLLAYIKSEYPETEHEMI